MEPETTIGQFAPDQAEVRAWWHIPDYQKEEYSPERDAARVRLDARVSTIPYGWIRRQPGELFSNEANRLNTKKCIRISDSDTTWQIWRKHIPPELMDDHTTIIHRDDPTRYDGADFSFRELSPSVGYQIQRLVSSERNIDDLIAATCTHRSDGGACTRHRFADVICRSGTKTVTFDDIRAIAAEPIPPQSILGFFTGAVRRIGIGEQLPDLYADVGAIVPNGAFSDIAVEGGTVRIVVDPKDVEFPLKFAVYRQLPPPVANVGEHLQVPNAAAIVVSNVDWSDSTVENWRVYVVVVSTRFIDENRPIVVEPGPIVDTRPRGAPAEVQPPLSVDDAVRMNATLVADVQPPGACSVCGKPALVSFTQRGGGVYLACSRTCYDAMMGIQK